MKPLLTRLSFIVILAAVCSWGFAVLPAHANESEGGHASGEGGEGEEKGEGKKKDSDISGGRFAGDPVYVHIAPLILPVISEEGLQQIVTVVIDVEVKNFDTADMMHVNMPRVNDALMRSLYGGLGQGNLRNGKLVNVNKLKAKTTAALQEVVGNDGIKEVLIQGVAQRMY